MSLIVKKLFYPRGFKCMLIRPSIYNKFSTNTDLAAQNEEEPDKLYKTVQIEMRGYEPATLKSYSQFATMAAECLSISIGRCWAPKKPHHQKENLLLLRSQFVHKKHRVQYEVRTYFSFMTFHHLTGSTADTFLEYIERNLPEGVALKVTKVAIEKLPDQVISTPQNDEIAVDLQQ